MNQSPIRVLIVDDSAVIRGLLARALEMDPDITVSGTAMHGELALTWMRKQPVDIVILDVEMPVMDGLTTLKHIQQEFPSVPVIMASSLTYEGAETTIEALSLGAAGCIAKPVAKSASESVNQLLKELVPQVKAIVHPQKPIPSLRRDSPPSQKLTQPVVPPKIIVIGASTGGPQALREVLSGLPTDFPLPILIVQHMPPMFTPMLAKHLTKDTGRPCQEATEGIPIQANNTYVAPGDYHMMVDKKNDRMVLTLNQNEPEHYCRPSVNPMFHSAADWYGKSVVGVMLTGMGADGIEGTRTLVEKQGFMIAQDEESSVVWGMPAAVVSNDLAHRVLPLNQIASQILRLCTQEACLS
ncbi:MAG: chemotaxis response regulator protein-glutamate methylesterase [Planctomycetes bacterium]|nr:chemotaxis response regulator protein-glutamate methylesterase [Planctomycetota bacterium]